MNFDMYANVKDNVSSEAEAERAERINELRGEVMSAIAGLESMAREYEDVLDYDSADDIRESIQYLKDTERRLRLR